MAESDFGPSPSGKGPLKPAGEMAAPSVGNGRGVVGCCSGLLGTLGLVDTGLETPAAARCAPLFLTRVRSR